MWPGWRRRGGVAAALAGAYDTRGAWEDYGREGGLKKEWSRDGKWGGLNGLIDYVHTFHALRFAGTGGLVVLVGRVAFVGTVDGRDEFGRVLLPAEEPLLQGEVRQRNVSLYIMHANPAREGV